jgi:hypothetical protein
MTHLEQILIQLREGAECSPEVLARALALVRADERIPEELRGVVFADPAEASEDAAGLLALLGSDDLGDLLASAVLAEAGDLPFAAEDDEWTPIGDCLAEGLRAEADGFEVTHPVMRRLPAVDFAWGPVLADAVAREAGGVDVAGGVIAAVAAFDPRADRVVPLSEAVLTEAGTVDVCGAVMAALDLSEGERRIDVAAAVRAEAGTADVADVVMARLGMLAATAAGGAAAGGGRSWLAPANDVRGWSFAGVALAAVALFSLVVGRLVVPIESGVAVAPEALVFAQAGDVVVEQLTYGDDVVVFQTEGEQGVVILWLDEEA